MKTLLIWTGLAAGLIALVLVAAQQTGFIHLGKTAQSDHIKGKETSGVLNLVCESVVTRYKNGLAQPPDTERMTLPVGIDLTNNIGWYTGEYTISMNRKGSLTINGALLEVSRPALFSRYGVMVVGEHFTVNRQTGEFRQWLDIKGGTRLDLIQGECKSAVNPPR